MEQNVFPASGQYTSSVKKTNGPFNALAVYWETKSGSGNALNIQVRTSSDGVKFSDWTETHIESHQASKSGSNQARYYTELLFLSGTQIQYKLDVNGVALKLVGISFIDSTSDGQDSTSPAPGALAVGTAPNVIKRAQWGANEGWRYSNGVEVWPREYRTPKVMIVHHSETSNGL